MILETYPEPWDFKLLDTGNGFRLEQWGKYRLARPDPQIIWPRSLADAEWNKADATYDAKAGKQPWKTQKNFPKTWEVKFHDVKLKARLTPFKHTGIFAEQCANWSWMLQHSGTVKLSKSKPIQPGKPLSILNLFAYSGAASVILAKAGHFVTHVDASKPAIALAKENQLLNRLPGQSIRWILDDAAKFVQRELKRGNKYDGILMDPPAFGHSPTGKTWKFNHDLPELLNNCIQLLSPDAKFLLINGYATNSSAIALNNLLEDSLAKRPELKGIIEFGELCLQHSVSTSKQTKNQRYISTGIFSRWHSSK